MEPPMSKIYSNIFEEPRPVYNTSFHYRFYENLNTSTSNEKLDKIMRLLPYAVHINQNAEYLKFST